MLPADEYERIYLEQGREAANAEFERHMRAERTKLALAFAALLALFFLAFWFPW